MKIQAEVNLNVNFRGMGELVAAAERIECAQAEMARELKKMERFMAASREELKAAMTDVADKLTSVGQDVKDGIKRLVDKVNAGQDFSAEVAQMNALGEGLVAIDADALAAGQDIVPVPVPTPTPGPFPGRAP